MRDDENLEFPESTPIDTGNLTSLLYGHEFAQFYGLHNWLKTIIWKTSIRKTLFRVVLNCVLVINESSVIMSGVIWQIHAEYLSTEVKDFKIKKTIIFVCIMIGLSKQKLSIFLFSIWYFKIDFCIKNVLQNCFIIILISNNMYWFFPITFYL